MLYIGQFSSTDLKDDLEVESIGHFTMVVDAESVEDAEKKFKDKMTSLKGCPQLDLKGKIYFDGIFEIKENPPEAEVLFYKSHISLNAYMFTFPNAFDGILSYENDDEKEEEPFIDLG